MFSHESSPGTVYFIGGYNNKIIIVFTCETFSSFLYLCTRMNQLGFQSKSSFHSAWNYNNCAKKQNLTSSLASIALAQASLNIFKSSSEVIFLSTSSSRLSNTAMPIWWWSLWFYYYNHQWNTLYQVSFHAKTWYMYTVSLWVSSLDEPFRLWEQMLQ